MVAPIIRPLNQFELKTKKMYTVLVVDDNLIFTMGTSRLIKELIKDAEVHAVKSFAEMEIKLKENQYQMLVICLSINSQVILNKVYELGERLTNVSILLFCENTEELPFQQLYKVGILGILDKRASLHAFNTAILQVRDGHYYIDNGLCIALLSINSPKKEVEAFKKLSNRENTIAQLQLEGKSNLEIGELMQLQTSTISAFKAEVNKKS